MQDRLDEMVRLRAGVQDNYHLAQRRVAQERYPEALQLLKSVLLVKPDHPEAHGKLGTLYAIQGKMDLAVEHLKQVAECNPNDQYGHSMLGWLAYLNGRFQDALEHYERAQQIEPYNAKINYHTGLALQKLGRLPEAIERFQRALTINPQRLDICQSLILALREAHRSAEAVTFAEHAARLTRRENLDVLMVLAETYAAADRRDRAVSAAKLTLEFAARHQQARLAEVRQRLRLLLPPSQTGFQ